jgi:hypothetical protein
MLFSLLYFLVGPWGSETRIRSCGGAVVLVDEPAEQIPPTNVARTDRDRVRRFGSSRGEAKGAMGSPAVVVLGVGPERPIEMPPVEDERPVEALDPDRLDHALAVGVGVRGPDRGADDPHPLRAEHRVEWPLNFASRSRMRNRMAGELPSRSITRFRACWVTQAESGCAVAGLRKIRRLPSSMNTRT